MRISCARKPSRSVPSSAIAALAQTRVLGHGAGDGVVEAEVERLEFVGIDGGVLVDGEPGDDLAEVTVVVDDLRHASRRASKSVSPCWPALASISAWSRASCEADSTQGFAELIEEQTEGPSSASTSVARGAFRAATRKSRAARGSGRD